MKKNGFTLIEVMIAMAIIAIMLAIAIPNYNDYRRRSMRQRMIQTEQSVQQPKTQPLPSESPKTNEGGNYKQL